MFNSFEEKAAYLRALRTVVEICDKKLDEVNETWRSGSYSVAQASVGKVKRETESLMGIASHAPVRSEHVVIGPGAVEAHRGRTGVLLDCCGGRCLVCLDSVTLEKEWFNEWDVARSNH